MSLCSQMLLLPIGVPPMPAPVMLHKVFPKTAAFGGCSPPLMWEMYHRARRLRITKWSPWGGAGGVPGRPRHQGCLAAAWTTGLWTISDDTVVGTQGGNSNPSVWKNRGNRWSAEKILCQERSWKGAAHGFVAIKWLCVGMLWLL